MTSSISSYSISSALRQSILTAQQQLANAEQEVSTGTYADIGLQLGESVNQDFSLRSEESLLETFVTTNSSTSVRLSSTQNALSTMQTTAQSFLETLVSVTNQNNTAASLQTTAQNALESLTSELNTYANGQYVFGGINSSTAPLVSSSSMQSSVTSAFNSYLSSIGATASTVTAAQMQTFLSSNLAPMFQGTSWTTNWSSASSTAMTSEISQGQTVTTSVSANQSAFQDLAEAYSMVASLNTQNLNSSALNEVVSTATTLVQQGVTGLTDLQANMGVVQNDVTTANNQMSVQMNVLTTQINNLENVDTYQVSTQVTSLQTQIETAYSLTSQLQKLSLVNYI